MARLQRNKNHFDEGENHERWLVSYADFVTLLFAFFVVMYSISSVNNAKYETLSDALDEAFSHTQQKTQITLPIDEKSAELTTIKPIRLENPKTVDIEKHKELSEEILQERRQLKLVSEQLEEVLQPYIEKNLVKVKQSDFWIELELNNKLLFMSGEAELSRKALPVVKKIAEVVRRMPNVINIEGHTDNVPIDTLEFPSNWDLSSARATTMVRELINYGISPKRLAAVGYGEFHPVADNSTEAGRIKNRRVVLVLMSQAFARYGITDKERAKVLNLTDSESLSVNN